VCSKRRGHRPLGLLFVTGPVQNAYLMMVRNGEQVTPGDLLQYGGGGSWATENNACSTDVHQARHPEFAD
jgi:hypothetical protein